MTMTQIETCSSFYRNVIVQPPFMLLIAAAPNLIALILLIRNRQRSIYDKISLGLLVVFLVLFAVRVRPNYELIAASTSISDKNNETILRNIAHTHIVMIGIALALFILQILAGRVKSNSPKKEN